MCASEWSSCKKVGRCGLLCKNSLCWGFISSMLSPGQGLLCLERDSGHKTGISGYNREAKGSKKTEAKPRTSLLPESTPHSLCGLGTPG